MRFVEDLGHRIGHPVKCTPFVFIKTMSCVGRVIEIHQATGLMKLHAYSYRAMNLKKDGADAQACPLRLLPGTSHPEHEFPSSQHVNPKCPYTSIDHRVYHRVFTDTQAHLAHLGARLLYNVSRP